MSECSSFQPRKPVRATFVRLNHPTALKTNLPRSAFPLGQGHACSCMSSGSQASVTSCIPMTLLASSQGTADFPIVITTKSSIRICSPTHPPIFMLATARRDPTQLRYSIEEPSNELPERGSASWITGGVDSNTPSPITRCVVCDFELSCTRTFRTI